jgi:hypothetical protein
MTNPALILSIVVISLLLVLIILIWISFKKLEKATKSKTSGKSFIPVILKEVGNAIEKVQSEQALPTSLDIRSKRAEKLKHGLKNYAYLDSTQLELLYSQLAPEQAPKIIEIVEATNKDAKINLAIAEIGGSVNAGTQSVVKSTFVPDKQLVRFARQIEEHLLDNDGELLFDLESLIADEDLLASFESDCQIMNEHYGTFIYRSVIKEHINGYYSKWAQEKYELIKKASGYCFIDAEWMVSFQGEYVLLEYDHPLNRHLDSSHSSPMKFSLICHSAFILSKASFVPERTIKLKCLGRILRYSVESGGLEIQPLALY